MKRYRDWAPSGFDSRGLNLPDQQDWFVGFSRNRDSDCLDESNFHVALELLGGEQENMVEVHRFGHWACGWVEIILVCSDKAADLEQLLKKVSNYPVLDEGDFSERETEASNDVWRDCYNIKERIAHLREHMDEFYFRDFADLMGCVRGHYFGGNSERMLR